MKHYTTPEQTAKLIELGFKKPKSISSIKVTGNIISTAEDLIGEPPSVMGGKITANYSIGELIEMLPISFENDNDDTSWLEIEAGAVWSVSYSSFGFTDYDCERIELIDALFDMVLQLKEEGVI